ncbi:MAG TPA: hypothetical protein EYP30_04130 [Archaeoglobaceae archaeon]|nr:hypothetical protein [Archaeoglobaceae archaeon]
MISEKIAQRVIAIVFKNHLEEMTKEEEVLKEYYEISLLALASRDKEAFKGFQDIINEIYWRLFFRKLTISSTTFFLILSPYMIASHFLLEDSNAFTTIFAIAIMYFMFKTAYYYVLELIDTWRHVKNLN